MTIVQKRAFLPQIEIIFDDLRLKTKESIYCDAKDTSLPSATAPFLHYHNKLEIGVCIDGIGLFYGNNMAESVQKGDIIIFLPGCAHYSKCINDMPCTCRFAYLDPEKLLFSLFHQNKHAAEMLSTAFCYDLPAVIRKGDFPEIHTLLTILLRDLFSGDKQRDLLAALHLGEFLIKIPKFFKKSENSVALRQNTDDKIGLVEAFIATHYGESITSDMLCNICFLSESQLRRRFKETYGTSPMQYLRNLRCNIAGRLLLHTDLSVADISEMVGYGDISSFYRHFVTVHGMSPSLFRQNKNAQ